MVVYERLALRGVTFCKPHLETEYQSMDAIGLIRNILFNLCPLPLKQLQWPFIVTIGYLWNSISVKG